MGMSASEPAHARSRRGGWLFLGTAAAVYAVTALLDPATASTALAFFGSVMMRVLPALALVYGLLLAANLLLSPQWVKGNLGADSGAKGWLMSVVGGVLATGPVYGWYALLRDLRAKGMRSSLAAVFLYSRAVKLPLLPLMVHYFGAAYTVVLCAYLLVFALVTGALTGLLAGVPGRPAGDAPPP
jgi:hypothetical protein